MKIIAIPEVYAYLENLVIILYENGYFRFEDAARKYVDDLYHDITTNLPICVKKPTPRYFDKYGNGMYYASFRKKQTYTMVRLF